MDIHKKYFGQRLKELRKSKNYTQEQLAEKIGMDTQNLCKMENGNHFPQFKNLYKIAQALEIDIKDLFDYNHFDSKEQLKSKIISFLDIAQEKDVELIYKIIKDIQEYNKH